jgi:hypothetical protein
MTADPDRRVTDRREQGRSAPPLKRALASRQAKSRYLERLITRVGV